MIKRSLQFLITHHFWISGILFLFLTSYFLFKIADFWLFPYLNRFIMTSGCLLLFLLTLLTQKKNRWLFVSYYLLCVTSIILNAFATHSAKNFNDYSDFMILPIFIHMAVLIIHFISRKTKKFQNYLYVLLGIMLLSYGMSYLTSSWAIQFTFYGTVLGFIFVLLKAKNKLANEGSVSNDA
ncbi:MAG: hypothetical protein FJY17_04610 [Bacteroidetes bacterium]|nr:hypothetical protein [Bacteroidota bacterium]